MINEIKNNIEEAKKFTENEELIKLLDEEYNLLIKLKNVELAVNRSKNDLNIIKSEKLTDSVKKGILLVNIDENKRR
jgi:hypothetical protein